MSAKALGDLVISLGLDAGPLKAGLAGVGGLFNNVLKGGAFETGKNLVEGLFGTPRDVIVDSVKLAASWERSATEFEVFTGSADKAKGVMQDLRKFAAESPLTLSKSIEQAKRLMATGVGGRQLIPTMEMLSDLAVGNESTLDRVTKAYTDVIAAGRLYGTELRQFTEAGIPMVEELAKVLGRPKEEIRHLMEAGRIGAGDMQKALKSLTGEGGRFYQMTARGAQTLEGQYDKLRDGVEDLKREFGRAIIEEMGLKEATKDGTKFADEMKRFVNDLRPGLRFVGDTIKGVAQVVGELVRNGPLFGRAFAESIKVANPAVGELLDKIMGGVKALQNFRLDPHAVVDMAAEIALSIGTAVESVLTSLGDGLAEIYNKNVRPIVEDLKTAADAWRTAKRIAAAPGNFGEDVGWQLGQEWEKNFGKGQPKEDVFLQKRRDDFSPVSDLYDRAAGRLNKEAVAAKDPGLLARIEKREDDLLKAYAEFQKRRDELIVTQYRAKWNPSRENFDKVQTQVVPEMEKAQLKALQNLLAVLKENGIDAGDAIKINGITVEAARPEMAGPASKWKAGVDDLRLRLGKMADEFAATRGKSNEQVAAERARDAMSALTGAAYGAADALKVVKKEGVQIDEFANLRAKMVDLNPVLKPPSEQFAFEFDQLKKMRDLNVKGEKGFERFGGREFALASADLFKRFTPKEMQEVKLPTAAEFGSAQASELYARANSGAPATMANLMQMILDVERQQLDVARRQLGEVQGGQVPVLQFPAW